MASGDTPATASSGDGGELWLTTVGTSIVSGLIGALIAALLVFRKMRSLKQTRTITSPLDNNSEYCEMHPCPGRGQPAWVRPYSISKVPGCLEGTKVDKISKICQSPFSFYNLHILLIYPQVA